MKSLVVLIALLASPASFADGFRCTGLTYKQNLIVYNNTKPSLGTRVAAVMIAADPKLKGNNKTIATFKKVQGLLSSSSTLYTADVDSRFSTVSRIGENIAGTKLGYLETIKLAIDFSYSSAGSSYNGDKYTAVAKYIKESGEVKSENMICVRYLKGAK